MADLPMYELTTILSSNREDYCYKIVEIHSNITKFYLKEIPMFGFVVNVIHETRTTNQILLLSLLFRDALVNGDLTVGSVITLRTIQVFELPNKTKLVYVHECDTEKKSSVAGFEQGARVPNPAMNPVVNSTSRYSRVAHAASTGHANSATSVVRGNGRLSQNRSTTPLRGSTSAISGPTRKTTDLSSGRQIMLENLHETDCANCKHSVKVLARVMSISEAYYPNRGTPYKLIVLLDNTAKACLYVFNNNFSIFAEDFKENHVYTIHNLSVNECDQDYTPYGTFRLVAQSNTFYKLEEEGRDTVQQIDYDFVRISGITVTNVDKFINVLAKVVGTEEKDISVWKQPCLEVTLRDNNDAQMLLCVFNDQIKTFDCKPNEVIAVLYTRVRKHREGWIYLSRYANTMILRNFDYRSISGYEKWFVEDADEESST